MSSTERSTGVVKVRGIMFSEWSITSLYHSATADLHVPQVPPFIWSDSRRGSALHLQASRPSLRKLTPASQPSVWAQPSPLRQGSYLISHRPISGSLISLSLIPERRRSWQTVARSLMEASVKCNLSQDPSVICFTLNWIAAFCLRAHQTLFNSRWVCIKMQMSSIW